MELDNRVINKNEILSLLIKNQLSNVDLEKKLLLPDLKRTVNNLPFDIFTDECCIWTGYITNLNKDNKNCYISFFHKNKKIALHRLLYCNFVEELNDNEYLKFTCENKGKCCSLKHLKKFVIEKAPIIQEKKEEIVKVIGHNNKVFF
jgi:hypothetical protein